MYHEGNRALQDAFGSRAGFHAEPPAWAPVGPPGHLERSIMSEPVTTKSDGVTYVDRGRSGVGGVLIGIAVLVLVAAVVFVLSNLRRGEAISTGAVTSAASTLAIADAGNPTK
jgi:hypothetical protein